MIMLFNHGLNNTMYECEACLVFNLIFCKLFMGYLIVLSESPVVEHPAQVNPNNQKKPPEGNQISAFLPQFPAVQPYNLYNLQLEIYKIQKTINRDKYLLDSRQYKQIMLVREPASPPFQCHKMHLYVKKVQLV